MAGSVRTWIPAALVALVVAALLVVAAWFGVRQAETQVVVVPSANVDVRSPEAVMTAVRHYYEVEDAAREQGTVAPMAAVTGGPGTPAFDNFRLFIDQQKQAGRRSVTVTDSFSDWAVHLSDSEAEVTYSIAQTGHDVDTATRRPVEPDQTTPRLRYRASLTLRDGTWLLIDRLRLGTRG